MRPVFDAVDMYHKMKMAGSWWLAAATALEHGWFSRVGRPTHGKNDIDGRTYVQHFAVLVTLET